MIHDSIPDSFVFDGELKLFFQMIYDMIWYDSWYDKKNDSMINDFWLIETSNGISGSTFWSLKRDNFGASNRIIFGASDGTISGKIILLNSGLKEYNFPRK
jgi:hypothetical protein